MTDHNMLLKIVFTGDSFVGKTSLLRRQAEYTFSQEHIATIGVDFKIKNYQVGKINAKVQLWDTAGQQRFRSIQKPYYKNANAICLCFSLNDRKTFENLAHWLQQIKNFDVQGVVFLVGCKSDLDIEVPTDQILSFASSQGVHYIQTSAKENIGVSQGFQRIVQEAVQLNLINLAFNKKEQKQELKKQSIPMSKKVNCDC